MTPVDAAAILAAQRSIDARVIELARALSLATRIETELVRLMRYALFPDSDAGLEANLWFSPLVAERDALGIALVPECRDELRRELMLPEHRRTLDTAWDVITRSHQPAGLPGIPPVVAIQEAISYHAIAGASATASGHRQQMHLELGTLFRALDDDSDGSLARWMEGALPALPEPARQSPAAIALAEKLRQRASVDVASIPRAEFDASGRWISDAVSMADVGCQRKTDGIEFSTPPAPGSHVLKLPRTSPLVVEVQTPRRDGWLTRQVEFPPAGTHLVPDPTPGSRCRITTASGHRVGVQPSYAARKPVLFVVNRWADEDPRFHQIRRMATELGWDVRVHDRGASDVDAVLLLVDSGTESVAGIRDSLEPFVQAGSPILAFTSRGLRPMGELTTRLALEQGGPVYSAEYSPDGTRIVTAGDAGAVVWDASSGERLLARPSEHVTRTATFSPDGKQILLASNDGTVAIWPNDYDGPQLTLHPHDDWVMTAEFSTSGRQFVTASQDRTAAVWQVRRLVDGVPWVRLRHEAAINHASFSPDETIVATASDDRTVVLWRADDGRRVATLQHDSGVDSAVWSPDGRTLLTADADGSVWIWDPATGEREGLPFHHDDEVHFATFSRDGRRIATATAFGQVSVWHVPSRAVMAELWHANPPESPERQRGARRDRRLRPRGALSVAFSPDDAGLLTAGADGRAVLWDVTGSYSHDSWIRWLTDNGRHVARKAMKLLENELDELRAQLLALDDRRLLVWDTANARTTASVEPDDVADAEPSASRFGERGKHALVAIVADGIDVLHETFLDASGRSRIVAIWDQRDESGPQPEGFSFGTLHTADDIARYVAHQSVPPPLGRNANGAGTHAASIAAGRDTNEGFTGVASEASIVAVVTTGTSDRVTAEYVGALQFVDRFASTLRLPVVMCVDTGSNTGPHDGTSSFEGAFDVFSKGGKEPGRVIVAPAGDVDDTHASFEAAPGITTLLQWRTGELRSKVQVELWWDPANELRFQLRSPTGQESEWIDAFTPGVSAEFPALLREFGDVPYTMALMRRHVTNGDSQFLVELTAPPAGSIWALAVETMAVAKPGPVHAWIGRASREGRFPEKFVNLVSPETSLVLPAAVQSVIAVGASSADGRELAAFSASGPTRDGREKPDVGAPGVDVIGARGGTARAGMVRSGSLQAAAHVAGTIALVLSRAQGTGGNVQTAAQLGAALRQTARRPTPGWHPQLGYGLVNGDALLGAFFGPRAP